jgi:hypothetical protein
MQAARARRCGFQRRCIQNHWFGAARIISARLSLSAWVMVAGSLGGIGASIRISNSNPSQSAARRSAPAAHRA